MTLKEIQNNIVSEFEDFSEWDEKYSLLIKLGRDLKEFPEEYRTDKNKIEGCQSQVWLNAKYSNGKILLDADSDSNLIKQQATQLLKVYSNQTPADILSSPPDFLSKIGIDTHLSPTRKNGLGAMLKQIQLYAIAFNALKKDK